MLISLESTYFSLLVFSLPLISSLPLEVLVMQLIYLFGKWLCLAERGVCVLSPIMTEK